MSTPADFPISPMVLLNANNVDGVDNEYIQHGSGIESWKNLGSSGVANFDTRGVYRNAPTFRTSPYLTSVIFDGLRSGLTSLNSKNTLGFIHSTGIFDLLMVIRRRPIIGGASRKLFGSIPLADDSTKGMQILIREGEDTAQHELRVIFGDGVSNILFFDSVVEIPAFEFVTLFIRGDGTQVRLSTDFVNWQSAPFTAAFGSGPSVNDYEICSSATTDVKFPGDVQLVAIYNRNLSSAELAQLKSAAESQIADVQPIGKFVVCLGDSLTLGLSELDFHPWPVLLEIAPGVLDSAVVSNYGHSGGTVALMKADYDSQIVQLDPPPDIILLTGFVNDLIAGTTATAIWATAKAFIDQLIADGVQVILQETSPWGGYSQWTAGKQTEFDALRALMIAYHPAGLIANINLYPLFGSSTDATILKTSLGFGDGLHLNNVGDALVAATDAAVLAPFLSAIIPATTTNPPTFGVTPATVKAHHFPQWNAFSANSNPSADIITEKILECAAELEANLGQESITASSLTDTASAAYLWCQKTLKLMAAIEILAVATQQPPPISTQWQKWLDIRWTALADKAHLALGTGTTGAAIQPDGPSHHISQLGIDMGDVRGNASTGLPPFRKDDVQ